MNCESIRLPGSIARGISLVCLILIAAAVLHRCARADLIIADSVFNDSDWTLTIEGGDNFGSSNGQDGVSGNPTPSRLHTIGVADGRTEPAYTMATFHATAYDPSLLGAIDHINWSYDWRRGQQEVTSLLAPAVWQNGNVYSAGSTLQAIYFTWVSENFVLAATDFPGADFSASGAPMQFGYLWDTGTFNGLMNLAIDNWNVEIVSAVPEPTSLSLVAGACVALLAGGMWRRPMRRC
ncbi:MAG: hypothetical protein K1X74_02380 [Pirellulales bacterium]|nr:hypothetical protein [Pirellulales bacterium]